MDGFFLVGALVTFFVLMGLLVREETSRTRTLMFLAIAAFSTWYVFS